MDNKKYYIPIKIAMLFSIFTIFLFRFGVWSFPITEGLMFYTYLFILQVSMFFGYLIAIKTKSRNSNKIYLYDEAMVKKIIRITTIITFFTFIQAFIIYTGFYNFSLLEIVERINSGLIDPSSNYFMIRDNLPNLFWKIQNYIVVLTGFVRFWYLPLGLVYWDLLTKNYKKFYVVFLSTELLKWIIMGTNKGLFDMMLLIVFSLFVKNKFIDKKRVSTKNNFKTIFIGFTMLVLVLSFFTLNLSGRRGSLLVSINVAGNFIPINKESIFWLFNNDFLQNMISNLTFYLVHGYYALYLGMSIPFTSTFGIGGSWFLIHNFNELFRFDIMERSYLRKIQYLYNYSETINWHTAYLWLANDFSFMFVPLVLFILMFLFGKAWKDFLETKNTFALLFFIHFIVFFEYISANNQVFSDSNTLFSFWISLLLWIKTRKKYKEI